MRLDLDSASVGPLHLGDSIDKARSLGLPEDVLEFQDGKLVCAKYDIDPGVAVEVGDFRLTSATTPLDAQVWFGDPSSDGSRGALRWIDYERGGATLALEFTNGKLTCVQLYAEGYA